MTTLRDKFIKIGDGDSKGDDGDSVMNQGKLIVDATCTPADITYPMDLGLLNDARELTEKVIDVLHEHDERDQKKPRTYREKARRDYLATASTR